MLEVVAGLPLVFTPSSQEHALAGRANEPSLCMSAGCSSYELQRAANIAANKRALDALGLTEPQLGTKRSRAKPRVPAPPEPTRRSSRGVAATARVDNQAHVPSPAPRSELPPWQLAVFKEAEAAIPATSPTPCFDARRHHQHLERSASGRSIATTGVAGYGVALVAKPTAGASFGAWEVVAVRFGVGGFGVGVVRNSMRPPYKSIGKSPDALGAYLANGSWAHAGVEVPFGPAYAPGDRIGVTIRPAAWTATKAKKVTKATKVAREIVFFLNGTEVGAVAASSRGSEELQLAVQPYMGGVALLANFEV
jgi:hypothetical protein